MYDHSESQSGQGGDAEPASHMAPSSGKLVRCAYCGKKFERSSSPVMPFCSIKCHRVDLGMWLNESYGLPWDGEGESEEVDE